MRASSRESPARRSHVLAIQRRQEQSSAVGSLSGVMKPSAGGNRSAMGFFALGLDHACPGARRAEKPGAPVLRPVGGEAARVGQHDERRQVVVHAAQAVADSTRPCWESRAGRNRSPA